MVPVSPNGSPTLSQPRSRSRALHSQSSQAQATEIKPVGGGWRSDRFRTTVLVNLTAIMERMDEQILPAVYAFIGVSFHAKPSELGLLTLSRALVQALSSPIGGLAGADQAAILGLRSSTLCLRYSAFLTGTQRLQPAFCQAKQLSSFCLSSCSKRTFSVSCGLLR